MSRCTRIVPIAAVLVAGVVFGASDSLADQTAAGAPGPAKPDLAGRWRLNVEKSDDARKMMREAREGGARRGNGGAPPMGGPGGGMGGARGGGGGPGGGSGRVPGGGRPGGSESGDPRESMRAALEAASELLVTPTENEIVILEKDGRMRTLHPDGKSYKSEGGASETKTRWEGARLVVETKAPDGFKIIETFAIPPPPQGEPNAADAKAGKEAAADTAAEAKPVHRNTMTVTVRVEGSPMPPMTLKRLYESVASSAE